MTTKFNMVRDINGYNGFGLVSADDKNRVFLPQNVAKTFTVPKASQNWIVIFSYTVGTNVFVSFDGNIATIPNNTVDTSNAELLPIARQVQAGQTISLITPDSGSYVTALYYVIAPYTN